MLSVDTLEEKRLTTCPSGSSDTGPAFSPDGRTLVFTRWSLNGTGTYLLRLGNNYQPLATPERKLAGRSAFGPAWTPDGRDIVFSSRGGLWRIPASMFGTPRRLAFASDAFRAPAVSRHGNRLAYATGKWETNIWRLVLAKPGLDPGTPSKLISSTRLEAHPAYSRDGKKIAFYSTRSGSGEIWVCDPDGSNAAPLTSLGFHPTVNSSFNFPPEWSPDGRHVAFGYAPGQVFVVNANGGVPWRVTTDAATGQTWPSWSRDGHSIYFRSLRSGSSEIWKVPAAGGDAIRMTSRGGDLPQESPDGRFLYYMKDDRRPGRCSVWRMPTGGGEETRVLDSTTCSSSYAVGKQGIYFFTEPDEKLRGGENTPAQVELWFFTFETGNTRKIRTIGQAWVAHLAVSPDGRTILYTQSDQEEGSDLMLVENFR